MAPPPNSNEPSREHGPHDRRDPQARAGDQLQPPQADRLLQDRFAEFSTAHSLSPLAPNFIERAWRSIEPRIRRAIIDELLEQTNSDLTFRPLAGAISETGLVTLLIRSTDTQSGHFVVPTLADLSMADGNIVQARYALTDFLTHGVGLLVTLPGLDIGAEAPRLGLDYLLSPAAMQLDHDRFIARAPSSVLGSLVLSVIVGRCQRPPEIESIARWRPADGESTTYQVRESDGTRHFVKCAPTKPGAPSGIAEVETVPPSVGPITFPRTERIAGKVGLHFEEFHQRLGFRAVDPESISSEYPTLKELITKHLKGSFPGFRPEWSLDFNRAVRRDQSTVLLLGISDSSLDAFVPGFTPESSIRDKAFSGLLLTMNVPREAPIPDSAKGLFGRLVEKFRSFRSEPRPVIRLDIVGPVLSDEAWRNHIELLASSPQQSFFFPVLSRTIEMDLHRHHAEPSQVFLKSVTPTRVIADSSNSWDKLVLAVDHSFGTHIVEFVRERSFGLIPTLVPNIQQYFPHTRRQKN